MIQRSTTLLLVALLLLLAGCRLVPGGGSPADSISPSASAAGAGRLHGQVVAGPTCPVVTEPPQPSCNARPVAGAVLVVLDVSGHEVGRVTSGADGSFSLSLAPGNYRLQPQPVRGLMGTAPEQDVTVDGSASTVTITYDTGIR
jgi:hypothetical protein